VQELAGEESKDSYYLFHDVHSVTIGRAFVRLYSRIVLCTFCFFSISFWEKFFLQKQQTSCKVLSESCNEDQHDSIFYSLENQHDLKHSERQAFTVFIPAFKA